MAKMDDDDLLGLLQSFEDDAAQFVNGPLRTVRDRNVKDYFRRPYGNEEPGWSQYVSSDTMDTIEWMLPDLLDQFISNDRAVEFQPVTERDVQGAEQATQGVNHVFYQQNPGFWILMSAFKDALLLKTCAVTWRAEEQRSKIGIPLKGVSQFEMAAAMTGEDDKVERQELVGRRPVPPRPLRHPTSGQILIGNDGSMIPDPRSPTTEDIYDARISRIEKKLVCKVECFEPENLGIYRAWTTPYLQDCPYVVRWMEVTLSEINLMADQMGFDRVTAEELASSQAQPGEDVDRLRRFDRTGDSSLGGAERPEGIDNNDESQTLGWLRMEWVLADYDGDGIAERRCIYRLDDKILSNEECSHVPVATGSPIPVTHRWDGMSVAESLSDLTMLHSELMRGVVNNAYSANNPRKMVLTDSMGAPYANVDDLLDSRPGGMQRITQPGAVQWEQTAYVGNQFDPLLQRIDMLREQRTGMLKNRMGMDPNAIRHDRTLGETQLMDTAAKQRIKLIARVFAETIVIPMMRGILKTLTEGDFDPFWVRITGSDQFVKLDPNEWRDGYSMVPNVGLGTGDEQQKFAILRGVSQDQIATAQSPLGPMMVSPKQIYNTRVKMLELAGIRDVGNYYSDPRDAKLPTPPPPPPPWQMLVEQKKLEFEAQKLQFTTRAEAQKLALEHQDARQARSDQNEVQQANDSRDAQREQMKAYYDDRIAALNLELQKYRTDQDNLNRIIVAYMTTPGAALPPGYDINPDTGIPMQQPNRIDDVLNAVQGIYEMQNSPAEVVRDEYGTPTHIRKAGVQRPIVRNPDGSVAGVQ